MLSNSSIIAFKALISLHISLTIIGSAIGFSRETGVGEGAIGGIVVVGGVGIAGGAGDT